MLKNCVLSELQTETLFQGEPLHTCRDDSFSSPNLPKTVTIIVKQHYIR
jgi:hypothetical protein